MPEMGGLEATAAIREKEKSTGNHVPIVAMTAGAMQWNQALCLLAGMDDYNFKAGSIAGSHQEGRSQCRTQPEGRLETSTVTQPSRRQICPCFIARNNPRRNLFLRESLYS